MKRLFLFENFFASVSVLATIFIVSFLPDIFEPFDPVEKVFSDMDISDLYYSHLKANQEIDTNIVIVNLGENRGTIAKQLKIISSFNPAVIGLDVYFLRYLDLYSDIPLMKELSKIKNKVMASYFFNSLAGAYTILNPDTLIMSKNGFMIENDKHGFINFMGDGTYRTIRYFNPKIEFQDSTYYAFSVAIANIFDSSAVIEFLERNNETEAINFRGDFRKFKFFDVDEILDSLHDKSLLKNKIVLLGYHGESLCDSLSCDDKYYTPLNDNYIGRSLPDMYGVTIHANIVSMILNGRFITVLPKYIVWFIAFFLCYINIIFFRFIELKHPQYFGGEIKIFVLLECMFLLFIFLWILDIFSLKINMVPILFTLFFAPDISEIYFSSGKKLYNFIKKKIS
ncbi:CHASE2 domain-containing protein [Bacteroidota bacterium]